MSKISIIVPCYNVAEYLPRCLDALLAQTYSDWQAVCVDDGSTDNSFEILQSYAEKDNRIVAIHQDNHGAEWARATAMEHIDSPYIMFCDPDDWYEPEMCEKMITTLERENVDIVMCGTNIVGMEDYDMQKYFNKMPVGKYECHLDMIINLNMVLWNRIYKKEILDDYKVKFPQNDKIRRGYDTSFVAQYSMVAKDIYFLQDKLCNYWQRENSLMHEAIKCRSKYFFDEWYGIKRIFDFAIENNVYNSNKDTLFKWIERRIFYLLDRVPESTIRYDVLKTAHSIFEPYKNDIDPINRHLTMIANGKTKQILEKSCGLFQIRLGGIILLKRQKKGKIKKWLFLGLPILTKERGNGYKKIYIFNKCIYFKKKNLV